MATSSAMNSSKRTSIDLVGGQDVAILARTGRSIRLEPVGPVTADPSTST